MKCRFLRAGNDIVCSAGVSPYVPSDFEAEEYCLVMRHSLCPFYCMAMTNGVFDLAGMKRQSNAAVR